MRKLLTIALLSCIIHIAPASAAEISGVVKGTDGAPLPGVSVYLEDSPRGTITDAAGAYRLSGVPAGRHFLVASLMSYRTEKREVVVSDDRPVVMNFVLSQVAIDLQEVVVTADKHEENLQNIPLSVSAIPAHRMENLTIRQRTDLLALAPNTMIAESGSHLTDLINIRGMFPSNYFATTTLFYYDGVPIFGYGQNPMYLDDIERIEILRGPQGTLYGRNAFAGVINVVSRKPAPAASYNFGLTYGNYADVELNAGASGALLDDVLFGRLSGWYSKRDGYFTNTLLGTNAGWSKGYGGIARLTYIPTEKFSAELFGNLEYIDESIWPMALNPEEALAHPYDIQRNFDSFVKKFNYLGSLKLRYTAPWMNLISTTSMQRISGLDWQYDADFGPQDIIAFSEQSPFHNISEELRAENLAGDSPLSWTAGLFFLKETTDPDYAAILDGYARQISQGIAPYGLSMATLDQRTTGVNHNENIAAFGQATYTLWHTLDITAGIRYEEQTIDRDEITAFEYTGTLPNPVPGPLKPTLGFLNVADTMNNSNTFRFFSQKYALAWHLDDKTMTYASVASGFHGGGYNSGANKLYPAYDPENSWNYELGVKTTMWNDRLRINADVFFIDWRKQQLLAVGDLSSPLQTIRNAGRTQIQGLELESTVIPMPGLTVDVSLGWLHARLKEYTFTDVKNGRDTTYDYSNNALPFSPDLNARVTVNYELPVSLMGLGGALILNGDYQYLGPYYSSHINIYKTSARSIVNARIGFATAHEEIYFWVKNLLDHRYVFGTYEYRGEHQAYLGAPRTLGVGINLKW